MSINDIVTVERHGRTMIATCRCELDLATHDAFRVATSHLPGPRAETVVLDVTDVEFMDCSALSVVLDVARRCAQSEVGFVVCGASPIVRRLLTALRLDEVLDLAPALDDALALAHRWAAERCDSTSRVRTGLLPPRLPLPIAED